jgi:hypothetical protein
MADTILMSSRFWQQTSVRMVRTAAQAAGGVLGVSATGGISANWQQALSVGAAAAVIALLMSLEKIEELPPDTAEEAAVDAMLATQGIDSGAPLPPLPQTSSTTPATTVTNAPNSYVPPTVTIAPPPPVSSTQVNYVPASAPVTSPATTSGYPTLGDPV